MAETVDSRYVARRRPLPGRAGADEFGPLARFVRDESITDIFVNGPADLWVDRGSGLERADDWRCPSEAELRALAVRLVALGGRHIDEAHPCVDVRLHDSIRLHAVLPPVAPRGTLLSIRIPALSMLHLDELELAGFFGSPAIRLLVDEAVAKRSNMLVTGAGGAGKTTFLSALLGSAPKEERIVAIEDVAELRVDHPHFVSLEARQPNLEGAGGIGLDRLLREALRMRPDRLVLGECRGAEIRELLSALNTGHDGGAGTLHANTLLDVATRIEALGALAGLSPEAVARQAVSAIHMIFHVERRAEGRRLTQVGRFELDGQGRLRVREVRPSGQEVLPSGHQAHSAGREALLVGGEVASANDVAIGDRAVGVPISPLHVMGLVAGASPGLPEERASPLAEGVPLAFLSGRRGRHG
ncbi:TadA family conjugal transfer-associated ATPase [Subtercola vilae]|uniref:TadA family conjugal transfer-associated ATPase n=1 Tax=Subtercola vilae TaxID=2056433 RepID=A0A4T2BQC8_9MICO|nr:TadA family conjugal transfer-associated ATPase [Subtercola vilae]